MTRRTTIITALALLSALPAFAGRVISTPFAETLRQGDLRFSLATLDEPQRPEVTRRSYRLDLGLLHNTELGIYVAAPEDGPTTTQFNLQRKLLEETDCRPMVSVGVWDLGHIEKFSGETTGGSFFIAASKVLKMTDSRPPVKVSLGLGTNRLEGLFGGLIVPVTPKLGFLAEYVAENSRLSGAYPINVGVYYYPRPRTRLRATSQGGNIGFDIQFIGSFRW